MVPVAILNIGSAWKTPTKILEKTRFVVLQEVNVAREKNGIMNIVSFINLVCFGHGFEESNACLTIIE